MRPEISIQDEFTCINCGKQSYRFIYSVHDRLHGLPGEFKILRCVHCGLYTLRPKLTTEAIKAYYPKEYIAYVKAVEDEPGFIQYLDRLLAREKRVRQIIKRSKAPGRILDVGCATGILLSGMQRRGWECYGVEPDLKSAEYACQRFGLDIYPGYLEDALYSENFFDVVTMMDVLEHVYDPINTLQEVNRILKNGGILIGSLPNADAWERYLFGPYWVGWEVPRHYRTFTPETIQQLLKAQGFKEVEIFSFTGRQGAFLISLKFWMQDWHVPNWIKKLVSGIFGSFPIRVAMLPGFYLSERMNKSTILSFLARK